MEAKQLSELPELETVCSECKGSGKQYQNVPEAGCYKCDGVGYIPTEFGQKLIDFMARRFASADHSHTLDEII